MNRILIAMLMAMVAPAVAADDHLPGTAPLPAERNGEPIDWAREMVTGIDRFLDAELAASVERRSQYWQRNFDSPQAYADSVAANRERLAKIIGAIDQRVAWDEWSREAFQNAEPGFTLSKIRWPVLPGVEGEGLRLVHNDGERHPWVIVLPDADTLPETIATAQPDGSTNVVFALRLAQAGCNVIVPTLVDRNTDYSRGVGGRASTQQPHREFLYRQAFEMGRHVIGYEVQKVLALVDQLTGDLPEFLRPTRIGIMGHGEGGLIALHAGAIDSRINVVCVSGYFAPREAVWREPIYRNVFGLLREFGDAEVASLIAPRRLIVEAARGPEIEGRAYVEDKHLPTTPGSLTTPDVAEVEREVLRARALTRSLAESGPTFVAIDQGKGPPGSDATLTELVQALGANPKSVQLPRQVGQLADAAARQKRQIEQLTEYTQALLRESEYVRQETFWKRLDKSSLEAYASSIEPFRREFYDRVIGRFDLPLAPRQPRTRKIYDEPKYTGYEVVLDVFPGVIAYGHLLVPKGIKPGERRPVVVCQHGLEGRPVQLTEPGSDHRAYHRFAGVLAERGYITYSPQNPYIFYDTFRTLQRKLNPLGKTLFSVIVPQHQQTVDWLASLPFADADRIAFYGLSYGGKTAMRVPPLVDGYCLSICSGDFNEWILKNISARLPQSYLHRQEYEIFEFDLGPTFNYAEMAALIAPRPFMVERGHRDGVAPDEWVAFEFAKVRRLFADLKLPNRTRIEFFDGPHTIHGVGTFEFLDEHLQWQPVAPAAD